MSNLYEKLGGAAAVEAAVERFYRKVIADRRVSHFFEGVDLRRLAGHQKAFLTMAFGGPSRYRGNALRAGHADLVARGLDDSHFDAVIELLGQTLAELGVAAAPHRTGRGRRRVGARGRPGARRPGGVRGTHFHLIF